MSSEFPAFTGNCPRNVNKDSKYAVRWLGGEYVVALNYLSDEGEQWLAVTEDHPKLVEMVNAVKTTEGIAPSGPFYINEYRQVIVPVADRSYYLAGEYSGELRFEFEGVLLTGEALDRAGRRLMPGDSWIGPHPGIPYVLAAGASDVYYNSEPRPRVKKKVSLSAAVGVESAMDFAHRVRSVKSWSGGRFYVNEWREIFGPIQSSDSLTYRYIGHLDEDEPWFPKPG